MQAIDSEISLKAAIHQLEITQAAEAKMMKDQFHLAYESVKPINLIKSTFSEIASSEDIKRQLVNTSLALASGYIAEKLFEGVTSGPLKKLLGAAVMFGVTNVVAKNPEAVKSVGRGLVKIVFAMARSGTAIQARHV